MTKKIGLLGGSFNPIHKGHEYIASHVLNLLSLDEIIFIPNANPPHKILENNVTYKDRCAMIDLVIKKHNNFKISYIEQGLNKHYTVDTLSELKKIYTDDELFFIMGDDSLLDLPDWKSPDKLGLYCNLAVFLRGLNSFNELTILSQNRKEKFNVNILPIDIKPLNISSTFIRQAIKNKNVDIYNYIDKDVMEYINEHQLYLC